MAVVATVTLGFIMVGKINTLAPIVTMPFLLTYACIDYAYFALAQTFDIQHQREQRFHYSRNHQVVSRDYTTPENNDLDNLFPERTRHKVLRVLFNFISFLFYLIRNCIKRWIPILLHQVHQMMKLHLLHLNNIYIPKQKIGIPVCAIDGYHCLAPY